MGPTTQVSVERVYAHEARRSGGYRVLVDRLWPRGVSKESLELDSWCKDVAPSTELRRWYGHDPSRFEEFRRRYRHELTEAPGPAASAVAALGEVARSRSLVLLTATRDLQRSGAEVLRELIQERA